MFNVNITLQFTMIIVFYFVGAWRTGGVAKIHLLSECTDGIYFTANPSLCTRHNKSCILHIVVLLLLATIFHMLPMFASYKILKVFQVTFYMNNKLSIEM